MFTINKIHTVYVYIYIYSESDLHIFPATSRCLQLLPLRLHFQLSEARSSLNDLGETFHPEVQRQKTSVKISPFWNLFPLVFVGDPIGKFMVDMR